MRDCERLDLHSHFCLISFSQTDSSRLFQRILIQLINKNMFHLSVWTLIFNSVFMLSYKASTLTDLVLIYRHYSLFSDFFSSVLPIVAFSEFPSNYISSFINK